MNIQAPYNYDKDTVKILKKTQNSNERYVRLHL
jgi:hypothetical protein